MSNELIKAISEAYKSMFVSENVSELDFPKGVYFDENFNSWPMPRNVTKFLRSSGMGYTPRNIIGVTDHPETLNTMLFFSLTPQDKKFFFSTRLKDGEFIARYLTDTTIAGNEMPVVKVSLNDKKMFFSYSDPNQDNSVRFEMIGLKFRYIRLLKNFAESELVLA